MNDYLNLVRSSLPHMAWPMLPDNAGALALAMQFQFEQTQWWSPAELEQHQMQELQLLLCHAHDRSPFWRERLSAAGFSPGREFTAKMFQSLPVLTRADLRLGN